MLGEDELRDAILLIFANKQDLPNGKLSISPFDRSPGYLFSWSPLLVASMACSLPMLACFKV